MNIYFLIVKYRGDLFKKFMQLSRGFRKHFLYHVFTEYMIPIADSFNETFKSSYGFEVFDRYLSLTPITFCGEAGSRLDVSLRIKTPQKSKLTDKSVTLALKYELDNNNEE